MAAPLPFTDGEATFRFPLLVAPRYIPGVKLGGTDVGTGTAADTDETPDASRITPPTMVTLPGIPDPVQLSIEVRSCRDCEPICPSSQRSGFLF
jgi:Ca-activated chloride channel family protein